MYDWLISNASGIRPADTEPRSLLFSNALEIHRLLVCRPQYQALRKDSDHGIFNPPIPTDSLDLALNFESHEGECVFAEVKQATDLLEESVPLVLVLFRRRCFDESKRQEPKSYELS